MIVVNYLSYRRKHFHNLLFHFMNKIKDKNKEKIILNIYTHEPDYFNVVKNKLQNIKCNVIKSPAQYLSKIDLVKNNNNEEFSIKLDEDIFLNNYIWDYMIENCDMLNDEENLLMTPLLSCGIPTNDLFIRNFFDKYDYQTITNEYLKVIFDKPKWMSTLPPYDYSHLNKYTVNATEWKPDEFLEEVNNIDHHFRGVHPIRFGYDSQRVMNKLITEKPDKLKTCKDFSIIKIKNRYFTNSFFMIKTKTWKEILDDKSLYVDPYDEVPLNKYTQKHNLNHLIIDGAFAIHTNYNTNQHPTKHIQEENDFYTKLEKKLINNE